MSLLTWPSIVKVSLYINMREEASRVTDKKESNTKQSPTEDTDFSRCDESAKARRKRLQDTMPVMARLNNRGKKGGFAG